MDLKGNKGELSELFVFFELLAEGKIYSADEDLLKTGDYVEVVSIDRNDKNQEIRFSLLEDKINLLSTSSDTVMLSLTKEQSKQIAAKILSDIQENAKLKKDTQDEILNCRVTHVVKKSTNKGDIKIQIYDPCLLYTSPSPRDLSTSRMPSSA